MNNSILINERVEVITVFRTHSSEGSICVPAKMKYKNQEILFTELGLRHPTSKGKRMVHVFDMSDGANDYRLEFDAEMLTWTLIAILEGHYAA
ncbi:MAG: hypothetical protein U5K77_00330 [Candidatus Saccharibacteria bacterium]|nr:hypothetical protein [Candidatus Saccharibacteria bacterium]